MEKLHVQNGKPTDEELTQNLKSNKRGGFLGKVIVAFGGILIAIGFFSSMFALVIAGALIALLGERLSRKTSESTRAALNDTVIPDALASVFENVRFEPSAHFDYSILHDSGIPLPDHSYVEGGEHAVCTYHAMPVELSSVRLTTMDTYRDEESGLERTENKILYQAQWMLCRTQVARDGEVLIVPRTGLGKLFQGTSLQTDNEDFNRRFKISADRETSVARLINAHTIERLLALAETAGGGMSLSIRADGTIYVAVNSGRSFFDAGKRRESADTLRARFSRELRWYADLIDVFRPA